MILDRSLPACCPVVGTYGTKPLLPCIPGTEGVFEVEEVGTNVTKFKPGDRVVRAKIDVNNGK